MTIDLSNPIVIGVSITVISAIFLGTYHYIKTLITLNLTNKKLSNILSELDTLHKNYKNEIADIKERNTKELTTTMTAILNHFDKRLDILLKEYMPNYSNQKTHPQHDNLLVASMKNTKEYFILKNLAARQSLKK